ncbi:MAG TPA: hypothetical protein VJA40_01980 [archaeon]|nr:hypothetical protein [archaeon]
MKASVKNEKELSELGEAREVHLVRPLSLARVRELVQRVDSISMSRHTFGKLSVKARRELEGVGVLVIGNAGAGRPLGVPLDKIQEVYDLKREGLSVRQIASETGVTKSSVHYLLKYASRGKISVAGKTIHLQPPKETQAATE